MEILLTTELPANGKPIVTQYTNGETHRNSTEGETLLKSSPTDEKTLKTTKNTKPPLGELVSKKQVDSDPHSKGQVPDEVTLKNQFEDDSNCEKVEDELDRQAMEELLKEAKRGAERARDMGPVGWLKSTVPKANKRFLNNTVVSTLKYIHSPPRKQMNNSDWNKHEEMYKSRSSRSHSDNKLENFSVQSHKDHETQPRSPRNQRDHKAEWRSPRHKDSGSPKHRSSKPKHKDSGSPKHRSSKPKHKSKSHRSKDEKSQEFSSKGSVKKKSHKRSHKKSKKKSKKDHDD